MEQLFLGIDTSNYTSSISIMNQDNKIVWDCRKMLDVKKGERGLRQSDALFQHVKNLPEMIKGMPDHINKGNIVAIGYSNQPRRVEGSYMPVFLAGDILAASLASLKNLPVYTFSHQEGHIASVSYNFSDLNHFLGIHISGGTTEILKVDKQKTNYAVDLLGGTLDISIGQLLDRTGVKLGFSFPAGKYIDQMALDFNQVSDYKMSHVKVKDNKFNLSGIENQVDMMITKKINLQEICYVLMSLVNQLIKDIIKSNNQCDKILLFGGVTASQFLRNQIKSSDELKNYNIIFGEPDLSVDNSVGISYLTKEKYIEESL